MDVAPVVNWVPEDGYKNLKIVVELDSEIDAKTAADREFTRRYKSLSTMRIVTNRGLQVFDLLRVIFCILICFIIFNVFVIVSFVHMYH